MTFDLPHGQPTYDLSGMAVGDSFLLKQENDRRSMPTYAKRAKIKLVMRLTPEGIRVWRVA